MITNDWNLTKILCSKIYLCLEDWERGGGRETLEDKGVVLGWGIKEGWDFRLNGEVGRMSGGTLEDDSGSSMGR